MLIILCHLLIPNINIKSQMLNHRAIIFAEEPTLTTQNTYFGFKAVILLKVQMSLNSIKSHYI